MSRLGAQTFPPWCKTRPAIGREPQEPLRSPIARNLKISAPGPGLMKSANRYQACGLFSGRFYDGVEFEVKHMIASAFVNFYRLWHGSLHLKGAGALLRNALPIFPGLKSYALALPEGQQITVDFRDCSAIYWLNHLLGDRFEEEGLLAAVKQQLTPQSIVWDVGANCGLFSYRLAREGQSKSVVFFEPNPKVFELSEQAVQPFKKVKGYRLALSDSSGTVSFVIPEKGSTYATLEPERTERSGNEIQVECITGDELITSGEVAPPDVIKIDTEGHELAVIRGLEKTISRHKPVVFFEHISITDDEVTKIVPPLYQIFSVSDADGSLSPGFDRRRGHNSVLMPGSRA